MAQAVSISSLFSGVLATLVSPPSRPGPVRRAPNPGERALLAELALRADRLLQADCDRLSDTAFVAMAERLVCEPLRTLHRRAAKRWNVSVLAALSDVVAEFDGAIGSLADALVDRNLAWRLLDDAAELLRALAR